MLIYRKIKACQINIENCQNYLLSLKQLKVFVFWFVPSNFFVSTNDNSSKLEITFGGYGHYHSCLF